MPGGTKVDGEPLVVQRLEAEVRRLRAALEEIKNYVAQEDIVLDRRPTATEEHMRLTATLAVGDRP